jgi:hypothetical protein
LSLLSLLLLLPLSLPLSFCIRLFFYAFSPISLSLTSRSVLLDVFSSLAAAIKRRGNREDTKRGGRDIGRASETEIDRVRNRERESERESERARVKE